jgi:hypothetical protein
MFKKIFRRGNNMKEIKNKSSHSTFESINTIDIKSYPFRYPLKKRGVVTEKEGGFLLKLSCLSS